MSEINYQIISKSQNKKGVTFKVAKTDVVPQTLFNTILNFFGCQSGKEITEEFEVFYPISKHGVHFDNQMTYLDGSAVSISLRTKIVALAKIAFFQEIPAKTSVVVD